jgi:hypothetical protein
MAIVVMMAAAGGPPRVGSDFEVFGNPSLVSAWR